MSYNNYFSEIVLFSLDYKPAINLFLKNYNGNVGPSQYNTRGKDSWSLSLHSGSHQQTAYESLPNYSCRNVLQTTLFSVRHLLFSFCRWYLGPNLGPLILLGLFHCDSIFLGVLHFNYDYVYLLLRSNKSYTTFALHLHIRLLNMYFL